jgi:hypothetical protein
VISRTISSNRSKGETMWINRNTEIDPAERRWERERERFTEGIEDRIDEKTTREIRIRFIISFLSIPFRNIISVSSSSPLYPT